MNLSPTPHESTIIVKTFRLKSPRNPVPLHKSSAICWRIIDPKSTFWHLYNVVGTVRTQPFGSSYGFQLEVFDPTTCVTSHNCSVPHFGILQYGVHPIPTIRPSNGDHLRRQPGRRFEQERISHVFEFYGRCVQYRSADCQIVIGHYGNIHNVCPPCHSTQKQLRRRHSAMRIWIVFTRKWGMMEQLTYLTWKILPNRFGLLLLKLERKHGTLNFSPKLQ
mmetsp:Transcript_28813/g.67118  ORF Transcript_28813/g.67118 Transcript_28813/m.67118 type:complete len:220 (+) Transcript_28813:244-903(+)